MYLYQRGKGASRRVMHLAEYDRFGNVAGTLCRVAGIRYNTSSNLPLGQPVCKKCRKALNN